MHFMPRQPNLFVSFYKIFLWVVMGTLVLVGFMLLRRPSRPSLPMTPQETKEQAESFNRKLNELSSGQNTQAHFTSDEISAAFSQHLAEPDSGTTSPAASQQKSPNLTPSSQVAENTPVHPVDVNFHGDQVTGQFTTNLYGKDVYITVSGRLGSKDGYVTFDTTGFKMGDFIVPVSLVNDVLQKKLAEPENREQLKLPDFVKSVHIENGELVVEEKN
jgi:hypothetical protein